MSVPYRAENVIIWQRRTWAVLAHRSTVTVDADERGFAVDGALLLPRQALTKGYVQPGLPPLVRLRARGDLARVDVETMSLDDGDALLRALHLDAGTARLTFRAPSPLLVSIRAQIVAIFAWTITGALAADLRHPLVLPVWMLLLMAMTFLPTRVITGADGVRIAWLGRGRFIPYSQMRDVFAEPWGFSLHLKDDVAARIHFEPASWWARRNNWLLRALFRRQRVTLEQRLREGLRAHAEHARLRDVDTSALLLRGERSKDEWLASLRALGSGESGYRNSSVPRDVLWRVAENASAPPDERVAAAVALREKLSADERARLEGLAEATAAPKVRVALTAAAKEANEAHAQAEHELAEALAECEEEGSARRRRA